MLRCPGREKDDKIKYDRSLFDMKITREKTKSARIINVIFGILSAAISALVFFVAFAGLNDHVGYAMPVLIACFGILFFLISVMINKTKDHSADWRRALMTTLAASAAADVILFIFAREMVHPLMIFLFVLILTAAAAVFILKQDPGNRIPLSLGIIGAGSGMLLLNTQAYVLFNMEIFSRVWIGFFFAAMFMALSLSLTGKAFQPEKRNKAVLISFGCAAAVQAAALLYALHEYNPASLFIFQGCMLAALISVCVVFYLRSRDPQMKGSGKKKSK